MSLTTGTCKLSILERLTRLAGPPHPGLVPQSGDPEHPVRWVRPEGADVEQKPAASKVGRAFKDREEIDGWAAANFGSASNEELFPVSTPAGQAFDSYVGTGYQTSNANLRAGSKPTSADRAMDSAIDASVIKNNVVAFRGTRDNFPDLAPGDVFTDNGFSSVSLNELVAQNYARGDNPALVRINIPQGAKGAWLGAGESEIVLPRGSRFHVVSARKITRGVDRGQRIFELDVLPAAA